jgi:hypothetical protein
VNTILLSFGTQVRLAQAAAPGRRRCIHEARAVGRAVLAAITDIPRPLDLPETTDAERNELRAGFSLFDF